MKNINKIVLSALLTALLVAGCNTDELQDLKLNPQAVTEINLEFHVHCSPIGFRFWWFCR